MSRDSRRDVGRAAGAASADLAATTATDVATRVAEDRTRDLEERLSRGESAADIQDRVHTKLDDDAAGRAGRLRAEPTFVNIAEMLEDADSRSLCSDLWVKCGTDKSFLLQFEYARSFRGGLPSHESVFVRLGKMTTHTPLLLAGQRFGMIDLVAHVDWRSDQSFEHAYQQFVLDCERTSQPVRDIDFGTALDELANSYEVMHRARTAPSPAARRRWAVSSYW